jgi:hypothetical protein
MIKEKMGSVKPSLKVTYAKVIKKSPCVFQHPPFSYMVDFSYIIIFSSN